MQVAADKGRYILQARPVKIIISTQSYFPLRGKVKIATEVKVRINNGFITAQVSGKRTVEIE